MSFWQVLSGWATALFRRDAGIQSGAPGGRSSEAASTVTPETAMQVSAVWACVRLIAETVASLPLAMYAISDGARTVELDHPLARLLAGKPNRYQTRIEFFETVLLNLVLTGNAYCLRGRRSDGTLVSLLPLMSGQVSTRLLRDGSVVYEHRHDGGVDVLAEASVWHLKLFGNGVIGLSPLDYARNPIGIAQAAEGAVGKIYRNGAKPSGVLSLDALLTKDQREQVRENFDTLTTGTDDRLLVLEKGAKFEAIALSPQDIELLASRRFQVEDICRFFGVPSVMVNDTSGSTVWGSGIQEIVRGFYKLTLRPILEKIEESMRIHLLDPADRTSFEFEFDFEGLLRADQKSRFDGYRVGIQGGIATPNECRRWEGLPPVPGGDQLYMQGATLPIDKLGEKTPAPTPAVEPQE